MCVTRVFGYTLPELCLIPFADCANHHVMENQYELFNHKLSTKLASLGKEEAMKQATENERCYYTNPKKRINFLKHFTEDDDNDEEENKDTEE